MNSFGLNEVYISSDPIGRRSKFHRQRSIPKWKTDITVCLLTITTTKMWMKHIDRIGRIYLDKMGRAHAHRMEMEHNQDANSLHNIKHNVKKEKKER